MEAVKEDYFGKAGLGNSMGMSNRPYPVEVASLGNYLLLLTYSNGEKRIFDGKPLFQYHKFYESLKDEELFNKVQVKYHTLVWNEDIDIDPIILYESSVKVED